MNDETDALVIETDDFAFEAPPGYQAHHLEEEAELAGPNGELLVICYYELEQSSSQQQEVEFANSIAEAMQDAAAEPDLQLVSKLTKSSTELGMPVLSLLAEADDKSHFFHQYALIDGHQAVLVTFEGDYKDKAGSALVEECVHAVEFRK